jgi:hypothetical protein
LVFLENTADPNTDAIELIEGIQARVGKEFGLGDRAIDILRCAQTLYPEAPEMCQIPHYVKRVSPFALPRAPFTFDISSFSSLLAVRPCSWFTRACPYCSCFTRACPYCSCFTHTCIYCSCFTRASPDCSWFPRTCSYCSSSTRTCTFCSYSSCTCFVARVCHQFSIASAHLIFH